MPLPIQTKHRYKEPTLLFVIRKWKLNDFLCFLPGYSHFEKISKTEISRHLSPRSFIWTPAQAMAGISIPHEKKPLSQSVGLAANPLKKHHKNTLFKTLLRKNMYIPINAKTLKTIPGWRAREDSVLKSQRQYIPYIIPLELGSFRPKAFART